jgi:hypothetical protein
MWTGAQDSSGNLEFTARVGLKYGGLSHGFHSQGSTVTTA